jgi:PmbA protein
MDEATQAALERQANDLIERARRMGADAAEALVSKSSDLSVRVRLGEVERVEEAGSHSAGLRVMLGDRSASASTNDLSPHGLEVLVEDALEMARLAEADPMARPAEPEQLATTFPDLDLYDPALDAFDATAATEWAKRAEDAARAHDARITNCEGASCARTVGAFAFATMGGFVGGYPASFASISVQPLADDVDGKKRTASHWDARRHLADLAAPEGVGVEAARRTVLRLGAKKVPTAELPVVFDPDAGRALLGALFGCSSGSSVYRRSTYLMEREGTPIASPLVTIVDDPLIPRLFGSRPFDGDGLPARRNVVVKDGTLETFLFDLYSARKLDRQSTSSAGRGLSRPSVTSSNFHLLPTDVGPEAIIGDTKHGLYVTSMMGFGFNPVTGDFSRGAEGFVIRNGRLEESVGEITISANFDDLFKGIDAVGNDLDPKSKVACPTFRVAKMTVSGT